MWYTEALSLRGPSSQPHYRKLSSARWHWAVLPLFTNAKVQVCAVLPRVPRFITVLPLPLGLVQKAVAAGLKHLPFLLDRCCRFTNLLKRKESHSGRSVKLHTLDTHVSLAPLVLASLSGASGLRQVRSFTQETDKRQNCRTFTTVHTHRTLSLVVVVTSLTRG